jgi:hypothetical protein
MLALNFCVGFILVRNVASVQKNNSIWQQGIFKLDRALRKTAAVPFIQAMEKGMHSGSFWNDDSLLGTGDPPFYVCFKWVLIVMVILNKAAKNIPSKS